MSRPVIDLESLEGIEEIRLHKPARFALNSPRRGGPPLFQVRKAFAGKGRVRISGTSQSIFVDVDPGEPEAPLIALDTIVRSDAAGLERMILSVLPHVDEIVLGVDGRSDHETFEVAQAYADSASWFFHNTIEMSAEAWAASKIDFSAARNFVRAQVKAPWSLVVDSDEFLIEAADLRKAVREAPDTVGAFTVGVRVGAFTHRDPQRLARSRYRWTSPSHNQLVYTEQLGEVGCTLVQDLSLRAIAERERRDAQRNVGIDELLGEAAKGNITALFHLAKHRAGTGQLGEAARLAEDYRSRIEPNSIMSDERAWVALAVAFAYYNAEDLVEAGRWATRALLDGPRVTAFCLLGDIAEDEGDLVRARGWFECACAVSEKPRIDWPGVNELRFGRLEGIRRALAGVETGAIVEVDEP